MKRFLSWLFNSERFHRIRKALRRRTARRNYRLRLIEQLDRRDMLAGIPASILKDINTLSDAGVQVGDQSLAVGSKIYFAGSSASTGDELWQYSSTTGQTTLIKDIQPGSVGSAPKNFTELNGSVYFTAFTYQTGTELWVTDGTEQGTRLVSDIATGNSWWGALSSIRRRWST
jgi:ELWxxDGT repeat protein